MTRSNNPWVKVGRDDTGKFVAQVDDEAHYHLGTLTSEQVMALEAVLESLTVTEQLNIGRDVRVGEYPAVLYSMTVNKEGYQAAQKAIRTAVIEARSKITQGGIL